MLLVFPVLCAHFAIPGTNLLQTRYSTAWGMEDDARLFCALAECLDGSAVHSKAWRVVWKVQACLGAFLGVPFVTLR